jgi:hypothetical protein
MTIVEKSQDYLGSCNKYGVFSYFSFWGNRGWKSNLFFIEVLCSLISETCLNI